MVVRPTWIIERLRRLGNARDRAIDTELRVITIDDDDAQSLAAYIDQLEDDWHNSNRRKRA